MSSNNNNSNTTGTTTATAPALTKKTIYKKGFCGTLEEKAKFVYIGKIVNTSKLKKGSTKPQTCQAIVKVANGVLLKAPQTMFFQKRNNLWLDPKGNVFKEE